MLRSIKRNKDGTVTETVRKLTKRIRALDGSWRTLVSFDGQSWSWDQTEAKLRRSLQSAQNLNEHRKVKDPETKKWVRQELEDPHTGKRTTWTKLKIKEFDARVNPGIPGLPEAKMVRVVRHGSPILGKAKGKAQKFRKNLRRRKEGPKVRSAKPVHFHTCPGEAHPYGRRRFSCSCERPEARHVLCLGFKCPY